MRATDSAGGVMDIKLTAEEMRAAVVEYVGRRMLVPEGYELIVAESYVPGITVYLEKVVLSSGDSVIDCASKC
jgi:hypothetical protein